MIALISREYPCGGEPWLSDEINYLKDEICFFPINLPVNKQLHTQDNVYFINYRGTRRIAAWCIVKGLTDIYFYQEIKRALRGKKKLKKLRIMLMFYGMSRLLAARLEKRIPREHRDGIVVYSYWMHIHAMVAAFYKRKHPSAVFVTRCHGYDLYENRNPCNYLPFRQMILNIADRVFPISDDGKRYLLYHYSPPYPERICVCKLGCLDHGMNQHKRGKVCHIVSCSSLTHVKRVDRIICALSKITIPVFWKHYGDGELREELKQESAQRLQAGTYELVGAVSHKQLMDDYSLSAFDVFINTSESEGIPVSIMEAMSFGIPVIATDVGGVGEIVKDGYNGFLIRADSSTEEIKEKIELLFSMTDEAYNQLRLNARKTWQLEYDAEKNYTQLFELIQMGEER